MLDLGDRIIGHDHPTYIIAEIGVNHDGDPLTAQRLIRAAADAGADAVKLQWFSAESLIGHDAPLAEYQRASGESSSFEMLGRLELDEHAYADLLDLAHTLGLHAIVTVFSPELVSAAARLPWNAFKVASPDLINRPLLDALASTDAPVIISTGAARHDEIVNSLFRYGHAALHCVSAYPTTTESILTRVNRDATTREELVQDLHSLAYGRRTGRSYNRCVCVCIYVAVPANDQGSSSASGAT